MKSLTTFLFSGLLLALGGCAQEAEAEVPPATAVAQPEATVEAPTPAMGERLREADPTRAEAVELQGGITQRQALPPNQEAVPPNQDELPPNETGVVPNRLPSNQNDAVRDEAEGEVPPPEPGNTYRTGRAHFLPNDR